MHSSLWRSRHWLVRLICVSHRVFSDMFFVPHSVPVTLGTYDDDLPVESFIVEDVRVLFNIDFYMMKLTSLFDTFLTRRSPSGSIVARLQTRRPATAVRAWYSQ